MLAGASAAMWAAFAQRAPAQAGGPATIQALPTLHSNELRFLFDRITNGWNDAAWTHALALGHSAWLEEQLDPASIDDSAMDSMLTSFVTLNMTSKQIYDTYVTTNTTSIPISELETAAILRGAYSKRQLLERMVEFWTDHFNVDHTDGQVQWLKTTDDRAVIRAHALGNFRDLLLASAQSGAMLYYLDNYRNFAGAPNENYAREAMELHTLGVGNYIETDVVGLARCLTGWQYYSQSQPNHGDFRFNASQHDNGSKSVLGYTIPAGGGINDGLQMIDILATHPATAAFLARKLCRFFLSYAAPQAIVDRVANAYLASGADIKITLRAVLASSSLAQVPTASRAKLKRPFYLTCSMIRACNPTITMASRFVNELALMGHQPLRWATPDGYPDTLEYWGSGVLARWTFLSKLFNGGINGTSVDVALLFAATPKSQLASKANQILCGGSLDPADVAAVQSYADAMATLNNTLRRDVLALSASSPSFQFA